jgi:uncharacterized protein involved in type VI secretion and phage assembly
MFEGLAELAAWLHDEAPEETITGLAVAQVIDNSDSMSQGRVQLRLPWRPGFEPWARVAVPAAGGQRGLWLMPQVDDEVLVGFEGGDVRAPYVVGSLWNGSDKPPASAPNDAVSKVILHTPKGHVIELDDDQQTIKITTISGHKATLSPEKIEFEAGESKATLEKSGQITLEGSAELKLKAKSITLEATTISVKADASLSLEGSSSASLKGGVVKIN